jgi:hypothetical protein
MQDRQLPLIYYYYYYYYFLRIINLLCGWREERNENGPLRERNIVMAER